MSLLSWIILTFVSLLFSALFSGAEIAYVSSDRVVTGLDTRRGGMAGRIVRVFHNHPDMFISTILVGNNIVLVIYGMGAAFMLELLLAPYVRSEALMLLLSTLATTVVILFVGEFFPKTVFRINPNASLRLVSLPLMVFYVVLWPVAAFTTWLSRALMRLAGVKASASRPGLLSIGDLNRYLGRTIDNVRAPEAETVEAEVKMFHNALDFKDTQLRDCMIPRNEIVAVDVDETDRAALSALFTSSGRSKILVYREDIDDILGYIHVSELFEGDAEAWKSRLKPVLYAPETLLADKMMRRLLTEKRSMAVVVDEFGGTAGLVTLEDLVEEIFGDIRDEHDTTDLVAVETAPGEYDFSGRIEVRTLRDDFRLDIPESDDYQTLAGYILHLTGELPRQGDTLQLGDYSFTVSRRTATRLDLIHVAPVAAEGAEPSA